METANGAHLLAVIMACEIGGLVREAYRRGGIGHVWEVLCAYGVESRDDAEIEDALSLGNLT